MKYLKKYLSMFMALLLMGAGIAGCSAKGQNHNSSRDEGTEAASNFGQGQDGMKGRYLENEIILPEQVDQIYSMGKLEDGSIRVLAENQEEETSFFFNSKDGGTTWETMELSEPIMGNWVSGSAIAPDGSAVAVGSFRGLGQGFGAKKISSDGQVTQFEMDLSEFVDTQKAFVDTMAYDLSGSLFVQAGTGAVLKVDIKTGEVIKACDFSESIVLYFAVAGEKLLLVTEQGIPVYSALDGSRLDEDSILNELVKNGNAAERETENYPMAICMGMDEGSIVYANSKGIYYHKDGGDINEQLVNGELVSLGSRGIDFCSITMADQEHILLHVIDTSGKNKLLQYQYDKNTATVPQHELRVYTLKDSPMVRQAAALFQKQYPEVYVKVEIGMTGKDGLTSEDAQRALSTDIMAGNGPDVLIMDGLPAKSYIEKGILGDISDIVKEVKEEDGIFENIIAPYEKDGEIYQIPTRFYMVINDGPGDAASHGGTISSFADYAQQLREENPGSKIMPYQSAKSLLYYLYNADSANWLDEHGSLDESALETWLLLAKSIYDIDKYNARGESYEYDGMLVGTASVGNIGIVTKNAMLGLGTIVKTDDLLDILAAEKQMKPKGDYTLFNGQDTKSFIPYLTAGINNSSNSAEAAKSFVKMLIGKEYSSLSGEGFPLNLAGFEARNKEVAESAKGVSSTQSLSDDGETFYSFSANYDGLLTDEAFGKLKGMIESLDTPALTDKMIEELVLEHAEKYLKGEESLEDTLSALTQKIKLYLVE